MERIQSHLRCAFGLARAGLLLGAVLAVLLFVSLRATVARADDAMLELGRHLVALSESGLGREGRGVLLNGQSLGFRVLTVEQEIDSVLDFYESWCRTGSGSLQEQEAALAGLDHSALAPPASDRSWRDLTMRKRDGDLGFIACLKHGLARPSAEELQERSRRFFESGNLRDLGLFHYAAATKVGDTTRVITLWTEGDFYPFRMFPAEGDAPGFDPSGIARPPSGRRMLSAGEHGHDETLGVYIDCQESVDELARFYRRDFLRRGWRVMAEESEGPGDRLFALQRGEAMRVVSLAEEAGEGASVSIATTR